MSLFRVYVDGALFYHPQMSKLAITDARIEEDAENIDSMTLSAPFNHPHLSRIRPLASTIVCKKGDAVVFEGRALDNGTDFYNTHTWTCESCLAYLKDSVQPPYDYKGTLRGLLELFISVHNNTVEEKKRFVVGDVTVTDNNDYISYSSIDFTGTLDAIRDNAIADIAQEKKKAVNDAKNEISGLAMAIAGKVVERELTDDDQSALIDRFIQDLGDPS